MCVFLKTLLTTWLPNLACSLGGRHVWTLNMQGLVAEKGSVRQSTFQMVWEGSVVGEAEVVTGSPYRYTMVTQTDCQLLYIHRFTCAFCDGHMKSRSKDAPVSLRFGRQSSNCL